MEPVAVVIVLALLQYVAFGMLVGPSVATGIQRTCRPAFS